MCIFAGATPLWTGRCDEMCSTFTCLLDSLPVLLTVLGKLSSFAKDPRKIAKTWGLLQGFRTLGPGRAVTGSARGKGEW